MSSRRRVGLLFGGRSVEHEVSVISARGVAAAMERSSLQCVPIGVTGSGRWLEPDASRAILDSDAARVEGDGVDPEDRLVIDPGGGGVWHARGDRPPVRVDLDVLFPLVHGWGGEDGRLQGALQLAELPCVGAGVLGSAVGMDKAIAKELFRAQGIGVVPWQLVTRESYRQDPAAVRRALVDELDLPLFCKPANGGSSVGISRVGRAQDLAPALELALAHDRRVVVERGVDAREIECAVLGNDDPRVSGFGEIRPSREYYDYEAKYLDGTSELTIPAELGERVAAELTRQARLAFLALDLSGLARIDFLVERASDVIYLNEVNTLPGFTPISMYPKLWEAEGLSYPDLIERLVHLAFERDREERERRSRRSEELGD